jgi:hypothetical protein
MGYTGTIPYTAQDFVPGQKALAQDITNISYAVARLDTNASNAYCVRSKPLGTDNQTPSGGNTQAVTTKTINSDPLGMATGPNPDTDITIPFDGVWTVSCFLNSKYTGSGGVPSDTNVGGWWRLNGVSGNDDLLGVVVFPSTNVTTSITQPFSAGDYLTPYFYFRTNASQLVLQRAYFSVVLVH